MTRRLLISVLLYVLALIVCISLSGAPFRVKAVHAISWLVILSAAAGIFWSGGITRRRKLFLLLVVVLTGAFGYVYLVNMVVLKFGAFSSLVSFVRSYALYILLVVFGAVGLLATTAFLDAVIRRYSGKGDSMPGETKITK